MKSRKRITNIIVHVFLSVLAIIWIIPIVWVLMTSLRKEPGLYCSTFFPRHLTLDNYKTLFTNTAVFNFPRWFGNTFIVPVFYPHFI